MITVLKKEVPIYKFEPDEHSRKACALMAEMRTARRDFLNARAREDEPEYVEAQERYLAANEEFLQLTGVE